MKFAVWLNKWSKSNQLIRKEETKEEGKKKKNKKK
jgi:hypothetical protein